LTYLAAKEPCRTETPNNKTRDTQAWADLTSSSYAAPTPPAVQQAAASVFHAVLAAAMADMATGALEVGAKALWQKSKSEACSTGYWTCFASM